MPLKNSSALSSPTPFFSLLGILNSPQNLSKLRGSLQVIFLCGARETPIDDNDLAGDKAVMQNQAQHAVGYVVFSAAALERRVFGPARHQPLIVFRQCPFHPLP